VTSGRAETQDPIADPPGSDECGYYVYGVVRWEETRVPAGLTGLDEGPVLLVRHEMIAAAVGPVALDRPPGRRAELMAHSKVVDALALSGPVVPVQFGSVMENEAGILEELLVPNEDYFLALLTNLAGCVQFNLKASYREDVVLAEVVAEDDEIQQLREFTRTLPDDAARHERVRLGQLVARALERKRDFDAAVVLQAIFPFVVAEAPRPSHGVDALLDTAFLVRDDVRAEFEEQLEGLAEAVHERIRIRLVGPVAPYDFVGGEQWA
jgi:hypothetical protein